MESQVIAEQNEGSEAQPMELLRNIGVVHILKQEPHLRLQASAAAGKKLRSNGGRLFVLLNANSEYTVELFNSSFDQHAVT